MSTKFPIKSTALAHQESSSTVGTILFSISVELKVIDKLSMISLKKCTSTVTGAAFDASITDGVLDPGLMSVRAACTTVGTLLAD